MRIGVVTFPGSLDDRDAQRAVREAGGQAVALWHGDSSINNVDAVILPGGFSVKRLRYGTEIHQSTMLMP